MELIGTHNSATGEKPLWYCYPIIPFARTLSKTIKELYEAGCRNFDIRIKYHNDKWRCAHGIFFTKRTAYSILEEINNFKDRCYVSITYEGKTKDPSEFLKQVDGFKKNFTNIIYGPISTKYTIGDKLFVVNYTTLISAQKEYIGGKQGFIPLDGKHWLTYLPIPWLWDRIYSRPHKFNNNNFIYVDFL